MTHTVEEKVKDAISDADDLGNSAKQNLKEKGNEIKDLSKDFIQSSLDKTSELQNHLLEQIKANPYKSLGLALIVGWLIGKA
jgi:ElaB/YqjD/DUF883 family membrane-anchored ribosome-binding protein